MRRRSLWRSGGFGVSRKSRAGALAATHRTAALLLAILLGGSMMFGQSSDRNQAEPAPHTYRTPLPQVPFRERYRRRLSHPHCDRQSGDPHGDGCPHVLANRRCGGQQDAADRPALPRNGSA